MTSLISTILLLRVGDFVFIPSRAQNDWLWSLAPLNTRLLGAAY